MGIERVLIGYVYTRILPKNIITQSMSNISIVLDIHMGIIYTGIIHMRSAKMGYHSWVSMHLYIFSSWLQVRNQPRGVSKIMRKSSNSNIQIEI